MIYELCGAIIFSKTYWKIKWKFKHTENWIAVKQIVKIKISFIYFDIKFYVLKIYIGIVILKDFVTLQKAAALEVLYKIYDRLFRDYSKYFI